MAEERDFLEVLADNVSITSENLGKLAPGSEERAREAKIYETLCESLNNLNKLDAQVENDQEKNVIERYRIDKELELRREIEMAKLENEKSVAKTEKITLWSRVCIAAAEMASGIGLGILYLKANMKYGGMIGKDGKKWFDDIKHIKL